MPLPPAMPPTLNSLACSCESLKAFLMSSNPIERNFSGVLDRTWAERTAVWLNTLEGVSDHAVSTAYGLSADSLAHIYQDMGTPAGLYPLLSGSATPPPVDDLPL